MTMSTYSLLTREGTRRKPYSRVKPEIQSFDGAEPAPIKTLDFFPLGATKGRHERPGSPLQEVSGTTAFTSLEELRRDAAFAAGRSTSVLDTEAERIPVGEARKTLDHEKARLAALEEKLAILNYHCSTWGREMERASNQVSAAATIAAMHPPSIDHQGRAIAEHYALQHVELTKEFEGMLEERERVCELLKKTVSTVAHLQQRLTVADTPFASRKAVSDSNRRRYFHSLFFYDWRGV